jgi:hypothetical protein
MMGEALANHCHSPHSLESNRNLLIGREQDSNKKFLRCGQP